MKTFPQPTGSVPNTTTIRYQCLPLSPLSRLIFQFSQPTMDGPPEFAITGRAALLAKVHVGVTVPVMVLTLVTFIARVRLRVRPVWRIRLDDWLIGFGFVGPSLVPSSHNACCLTHCFSRRLPLQIGHYCSQESSWRQPCFLLSEQSSL